jgi:hypothetical protein
MIGIYDDIFEYLLAIANFIYFFEVEANKILDCSDSTSKMFPLVITSLLLCCNFCKIDLENSGVGVDQ